MLDNQICPEEDCVDKEDLPTAMEMAKNLASDGAKIIKNAVSGKRTFVDSSVRYSRWSTCIECPRLQNERCLECGCFMQKK